MVLAAKNQTAKRALPPGWRWVRLGEVCEFLDSRRVPVNDSDRTKRIAGKKPSELFPYYGANGQVGWIDGYLFEEPLILLAEDGGNFGSADRPIAYAVTGKCWVNNHAHVLRPLAEIDFDFCLQALRIRPDVGDLVSGSTRAKLNQEIASGIPIPLPPLDEQKRIAAILNDQMATVQRARAAAEGQLEAAKALPAAYLRAVFSSPEAHRWPRKSLRDLCGSDGQYGTSEKADSSGVGLPILRMGNILDGRLLWDDLKFIQLSKVDEEKYRLVKGDLVFNRTNSAELVGKTAVYDGSRDAVFASYLIRFRPKGTLADSTFVCSYINSKYGRKFIEHNMARAIGQVNISASTMHRMPIPAPPLIEQHQIAAMLDNQMVSAKRARRAIEEELDAINKLPSALLRRAFNGEL